jgi:hypothetical protein
MTVGRMGLIDDSVLIKKQVHISLQRYRDFAIVGSKLHSSSWSFQRDDDAFLISKANAPDAAN